MGARLLDLPDVDVLGQEHPGNVRGHQVDPRRPRRRRTPRGRGAPRRGRRSRGCPSWLLLPGHTDPQRATHHLDPASVATPSACAIAPQSPGCMKRGNGSSWASTIPSGRGCGGLVHAEAAETQAGVPPAARQDDGARSPRRDLAGQHVVARRRPPPRSGPRRSRRAPCRGATGLPGVTSASTPLGPPLLSTAWATRPPARRARVRSDGPCGSPSSSPSGARCPRPDTAPPLTVR